MVLADGSVVHADDAENADLFWAVRGAGANVGVVTSFEFEVDEVGDVGFGQLVLDGGADPADFRASSSGGAASTRRHRATSPASCSSGGRGPASHDSYS